MPSVERRRAIRQCLVCHANVLDFPPPEGHGDFKQRVNMTMTKLCLTHWGRVRGAFFCALIKYTTNLFSNNQLTEFPWLVTQRPKEHTGMSPRKGFKCPFQCLSFFPALISFISLGKWLNFAEDQLGWAQWAHSHIIKSELGLNAIISAECMSFSGSSVAGMVCNLISSADYLPQCRIFAFFACWQPTFIKCLPQRMCSVNICGVTT